MHAASPQPTPHLMTTVPNFEVGSGAESKSTANSGIKLSASNLNFYYGGFQALRDISLRVYEKQVTAFIGPSGCGKSTFLRTLNRMNETVRGTRSEGEILFDGDNIRDLDVNDVRRRVGMVFQRSNPFPKSIFDNV